MDRLLPFLDVFGPHGQQFHMEMTKDRVTIGRFGQFNDRALAPDPQQLITRKAHCALERDTNGWWVIDNGSVKRTFVRQGTTVEVVLGRALLEESDSIRILGKGTETDEPLCWELTLRDPLGNRPAGHVPHVASPEYDWVPARFFRVDGSSRQEIHDLRPQEHKLIRYIDQRNRTNWNAPAMCTYEELLTAI